ncbi:MAG: 3-phosphoshikimate 1-carboxyvinyltransferase [Armatimonadota bacterium]|nr:3-phosphoshikimate 1-carboxyvinyltransferase [Armatimonadota bacterium]
MRLRVRPCERLSGSIRPPGDKSISHRAAMLSSIATGIARIEGFLECDDCLRTAEALRAMGVHIEPIGTETLEVHGAGLDGLQEPDQPLEMGNSATGMRLMMGLVAGRPFEVTLAGDESLSQRPMDRIARPLELMGGRVQGRGERCLPPVTVRGGDLGGIEYHTPMASAQVKSAILLAGLQAVGETRVIEPGPSRDHTERMLRAMGADIEVEDLTVTLRPGRELQAQSMQVPADLSSTAFVLVAALLTQDSEVLAEETLLNPRRTGLLEVLEAMGADLEVGDRQQVACEPVGNILARSSHLAATEAGGELIPRMIDEVPVLAVAATQAEGTTVISDAQELRVKESDRLAAMAEVLSAMAADITEREDGLEITGPTPLRGATVDSRGDHRVAMSAAVAGLVAEGETIVERAECIATSFPGFTRAMQELGAECVEEEE